MSYPFYLLLPFASSVLLCFGSEPALISRSSLIYRASFVFLLIKRYLTSANLSDGTAGGLGLTEDLPRLISDDALEEFAVSGQHV